MPSRAHRVKTVIFTWAQEARWSTLWRRWTMSPFTAKRRRANACRPSGPCPAPSITCAWRGPRPVRTAAVSPPAPGGSRKPTRKSEGGDRSGPGGREGRKTGRKEGRKGRGSGRSWRAEESGGTVLVLGSGVWAAADFGEGRGGAKEGARAPGVHPRGSFAAESRSSRALESRYPGPGRKLIGR